MANTAARKTDKPTLPVQGAWATTDQLCGRLQISRTTFWRWAKTPGFPQPIRFGRSVRWAPDRIEAFLAGQEG